MAKRQQKRSNVPPVRLVAEGRGGSADSGDSRQPVVVEVRQPAAESAALPSVSLCTVTYNRAQFLPLLQRHILAQTYPRHRLEWVLVDDSDDGGPEFQPDQAQGLKIVHRRLDRHLPLGEKRNLSHTLCSGDIIVYLDDDDYYPPTRVAHAVERLLGSEALIAGSTILPILFLPERELWIAGPYGSQHATAGTFAFKRQLLEQSRYDDAKSFAEEKSFLKDYTLPMVQLDPNSTILCIAHDRNTFEKRKLIAAGKNPRFRRVDQENTDGLLNHLGDLLPSYESLVLRPQTQQKQEAVVASRFSPPSIRVSRLPHDGPPTSVDTSIGATDTVIIKSSGQDRPDPAPPGLPAPKSTLTPVTEIDESLLHFKIIIPVYNGASYIKRCIESIRAQVYHNYQAVVIDDGSTDDTARIAQEAIAGDTRFLFDRRSENSGSPLDSFMRGVKLLRPNPHDVLVTVDGDDSLYDQDALQIVAFTYMTKHCLLTYGSFVRISDQAVFGSPYDARTVISNTFRKAPWKASHLRTFMAGLLELVDPRELREANGNFVKRAGDIALMHPLLEIAAHRSECIATPLYLYNDTSPQNEHRIDHSRQAQTSLSIRALMPSAPAPFVALNAVVSVGQLPVRSGHEALVSVIIPTKNREPYLLAAIRYFQAQTWPHKELLILDDSETASQRVQSMIRSDPRIRYIHEARPQAISDKRRRLCELAQGHYVAHFDDDDYYAPTYLETMISTLIAKDLDFIKLRSWCNYHAGNKVYGFCNTSLLDRTRFYRISSAGIERFPRAFAEHEMHNSLYGYGFSYVYKKSLLLQVDHSENVNFGDDIRFANDCLGKGARIGFYDDIRGIAIHIIHSGNTSSCFAQHLMSESTLNNLTSICPLPPDALPA